MANAIKLREPTSRGLSAGSMNLSTSLDPADKPRDVGEENALNLMAVTLRAGEDGGYHNDSMRNCKILTQCQFAFNASSKRCTQKSI